jgi:Aminotransferase class-III
VTGTGGVIGPADGYLEGLASVGREHDILLIADEVITGFGRTSQTFGSQRYGITPDLITMAKGIISGYAPLGGVLVSPRVAGRFFAGPPGGDAPVFRARPDLLRARDSPCLPRLALPSGRLPAPAPRSRGWRWPGRRPRPRPQPRRSGPEP